MGKKSEFDEEKFVDDASKLWTKDLMRKYKMSRSTVKRWKKILGVAAKGKVDKPTRYVVVKNGCWVCTSHKINDKGYPQCKGERLVAIREWVKLNGEWPAGAHCLHSCDNTVCVNPEHISPGTQQENQRQMAERHRSPWGWRSGARKLSPEQACEAYEMKGKASLREVAKKFGVSSGTIFYLWSGRMWWRDVAGMENFPAKLSKDEEKK